MRFELSLGSFDDCEDLVFLRARRLAGAHATPIRSSRRSKGCRDEHVGRFAPESLTSEKYNEARRRLDAAGHWPPDGLEYHVCFGAEGQLKVSEIWASKDQFEAFGAKLRPILEEVGIKFSGPPELIDVYNQERF